MPQLVPDDPDLRAAVRGDPAGRDALLARFGGLVWTLCARLAEDPEDARQDAWERILGVIGRFDPAGSASLQTWLVTVVHRMLIDRHRRKQVRGTVIELPDLQDEAPSPEARLAGRQRAEALDRALERLAEPHRRVVLLHHVGGQSLDAIAEVEGVPVGTVKSRLHRARAQLARALEDLR